MPTSALGLSYVQSTILLIAGGAVLLFMLVVSSYRLSTDTSTRAEVIAKERLIRIAARQTQLGLLSAESGQRGFLVTREPSYLDAYEVGLKEVREGLKLLRERTNIPEDLTLVAEIEPLIEDKLDELKSTIELAKSGRWDDALVIVRTNRGRDYMKSLRAKLEEITRRADGQVGQGLHDLAQSASRLSATTAFGSLLLVALATLAFYMVANNTGKLIAAQQSLQNLTNELEDRVKERTKALTEANDEIQRFAYIVSHDLRAPLVNIMGFTSELESASKQLSSYFSRSSGEIDEAAAAALATEDIPESVGFIRKSSEKMDGLIGAILKLSREGRRELKRERVQLNEVVESALATLQHQLDNGNVKVDVSPAFPSVVSDKLALSQIVGNVLDNAVKYLVPGRPGEIKITAEESGGRVKLQIADNGRGIAGDDLKRIFELFRRAGKPDRPGEGIGLAHVRSLVRALGGDVAVASKLGEGSTFTIELPKKMALTKDQEA